MKTYTPLHCHTHYSLLDGLSKPEKVAERLDEIGVEACAITDHGNISGSVAFSNALRGHERPKKSILGCELYVCSEHATIQVPENQKLLHLPVLAKNKAGWNKLIHLTSSSNSSEHFYHKPRLSLDQITEYSGNLIGFSGHLGSHIASSILVDGKPHDNWRKQTAKLAEWMRDCFGKDNFYLEIQLMDHVSNPLQKVVADCVRTISKDTGIPCIATPDAHYARSEDAIDQRILLCTNLRKTLTECYNDKNQTMGCFFKSENYHIPSYEEMLSYGHTEEELDNTMALTSTVDDYQIVGPPIFPQFECPGGISADDHLRQMCRDGFRQKVLEKGLDTAQYGAQADKELKVFVDAQLSAYFLIVQDVLQFCTDKGWMLGPGRGSAAGCLVSYLIDITQIDPLPHELWFERFYNAGRNSADHVSIPDIDMDVPITKRAAVIDYLKEKYGQDKVSQMITYQTMKGSGALKAVLRAHGGVPFEMMNEMTKNMPEEAKISSELQAMKDATGSASIIQWALENRAKDFADWVTMDDEGNLEGPFAQRFEQAMRLEGTKVAQSKHAAGVVIAPEALSNICPMVLDTKSKERNMIAGLEMNDLEALGLIKFDVLGIAYLDKIMGIQDILGTGEIQCA